MRPVAEPRSGGISHARVGRLVQHQAGTWNRSATSRPRSMKDATISRLRWPMSRNSLSDKPGTVHYETPILLETASMRSK